MRPALRVETRFTFAPATTEVPAHVRRAIDRGLSRERADRHPSMNAMLAAFEAPVAAPPRSRSSIGLVAVLALFGIVAGASIVAWRVRAKKSVAVAPTCVVACAQKAYAQIAVLRTKTMSREETNRSLEDLASRAKTCGYAPLDGEVLLLRGELLVRPEEVAKVGGDAELAARASRTLVTTRRWASPSTTSKSLPAQPDASHDRRSRPPPSWRRFRKPGSSLKVRRASSIFHADRGIRSPSHHHEERQQQIPSRGRDVQSFWSANQRLAPGSGVRSKSGAARCSARTR